MRDAIAFALGNFTLTFFVLGLLGSAIALWHTRQPRTSAVVLEALFSYFLLFSIAFANPLQFRLACLLWEGGGSLHRMGGQPLPVRGRLCEPRLCSAGIAGVQGEPRFATGGHRWAGLLSMGRGRRSRFSDDDGAEFCSRQCWRHFLQRCLGSDLGLHISLATKQCRPDISAAMRAKRSMRERLHRQAVDARTNREHSPRTTLTPSAVEKHDGAGESGDVAGAWD
jgi:hypothetical protein